MVMFRYYLLGGNTTTSSGLYARLCHTFLVLAFYHYHFLLSTEFISDTDYILFIGDLPAQRQSPIPVLTTCNVG